MGKLRKAGIAALALLLCLPALAGAADILKPLNEPFAAPDFDLQDLDDRHHRLSGLRGKVVVINFWATWCPPCRKEMPSIQRAWEKLRDKGVLLLAVNVGETEDAVLGFVTSFSLDFPVLLDPGGKVIAQWPAVALPTTFVIDPNGNAVYRVTGALEWDEPQVIEQLLSLRGGG